MASGFGSSWQGPLSWAYLHQVCKDPLCTESEELHTLNILEGTQALNFTAESLRSLKSRSFP